MDLITDQEAVSELKKLRDSRFELIKAYERKRSWRPSERAMAIADVMHQVTAINHAIKACAYRMPVA
jgi:hypothetical protein